MSLCVLTPGLQTTLQGKPRYGARHMGMPWAGPADSLSMALANRLVGNAYDTTALELTYGNARFAFEADAHFAITGAPVDLDLAGRKVLMHRTQKAKAGDTLTIGNAVAGMRIYLAVSGGLKAECILGSTSTYLPAGLGGFEGRALKSGDVLGFGDQDHQAQRMTPNDLRPFIGNTWALRAMPGLEAAKLDDTAAETLFGTTFTAAPQVTRIGIGLEGPHLELASDGRMKSAPVFPGTIQCPESGQPVILGVDAQTTGGYPRVAQILRCDMHMLGQIRPHAHVRLIRRSLEKAERDYALKAHLFARWLPGFQL